MKQKSSDGDLKSSFTPWESVQTDPEAPKKTDPEAFTIENIMKFDLYAYLVASTHFYMENKIALKKELLSGITVAVMQVPEVRISTAPLLCQASRPIPSLLGTSD